MQVSISYLLAQLVPLVHPLAYAHPTSSTRPLVQVWNFLTWKFTQWVSLA